MSTNFNEWDILFHNFFHPTSGFLSASTTKQPHPLNIYYDETGLHFEVACTGLTKSDVKLDIEDDILKISYDKPDEAIDKQIPLGTIHRGLSKKSFNLGYKISSKYDLSKADGKLENGLLEIFIPISEKSKPKTIKIK
jgi:HSP20 family molecular chaperone IbpA